MFNFINRGAPLSDAERKELNLEAARLIESLGIPAAVEENGHRALITFSDLRVNMGYVGFADYYLGYFYDESKLINKADIRIYNQLLDIDSKLGTTQTEQLIACVYKAIRMDLIKV